MKKFHKWQVRVQRTVVQYTDVYIYVEEGYSPFETAVDTIKQPLQAPVFGGANKGKKEIVWNTKEVSRVEAVECIQLPDKDGPSYGVLDLSRESKRLFE